MSSSVMAGLPPAIAPAMEAGSGGWPDFCLWPARAPAPDLEPDSAQQLQAKVLSVSEAAAGSDPASALKSLDELVVQPDASAADGGVSFKRHQSIMKAIEAVRADLAAAQAQAQAAAAAEAAAAAAPPRHHRLQPSRRRPFRLLRPPREIPDRARAKKAKARATDSGAPDA